LRVTGPGSDLSEESAVGIELAALDCRVAPVCPPGSVLTVVGGHEPLAVKPGNLGGWHPGLVVPHVYVGRSYRVCLPPSAR